MKQSASKQQYVYTLAVYKHPKHKRLTLSPHMLSYGK